MQQSTPEKPETIPADRPLRRRAILLGAVIAVAGMALLWMLQGRLTHIQQTARQDVNVAVNDMLRLVRIWALTGGVGFVGIGLWFSWLAWRIRSAGQFPPPGMKVLRDTPVRTGPPARRLAVLAFVTAVVALLTGTVGMGMLYQLALTMLRPGS